MRNNPTYTYYAGFEYEFKKITKKYGKKTYFEKEYEDEIRKYKESNVNESDNDDEEESDDDSSDSDDDFDNLTDTNKKIMLSNADVDLVRNNFTNEKYNILSIVCKRSINSKNPDAKAKEVIIKNY